MTTKEVACAILEKIAKYSESDVGRQAYGDEELVDILAEFLDDWATVANIEGYKEGLSDGIEDGYKLGQDAETAKSYNEGWKNGYQVGYADGDAGRNGYGS